MPLSNSLKTFILGACFTFLSLSSTASRTGSAPQSSDKTIIQLYHSLNSMPKSDISTRITLISAEFLEKPYSLGALGEGMNGQIDQSPLYRTDAFDCETFVDTVLALAFGHDIHQFRRCINQIRYHRGLVSFVDRNHFTDLDWNKNNQTEGFVKDITTTLLNEQNQPVAQSAHALINKSAWYSHFSTHNIRIQTTDLGEKEKRLRSLKQQGHQIPSKMSTISYIPLSVLFDKKGKANMHLFRQIPNAAIIEIIRPNWDLTKTIGTHLNVSHLGFAIWQNNILFFREASSESNRVVDIPLIQYLRSTLKSPTIKGINIQIVLPQPNTDMLCATKTRH